METTIKSSWLQTRVWIPAQPAWPLDSFCISNNELLLTEIGSESLQYSTFSYWEPWWHRNSRNAAWVAAFPHAHKIVHMLLTVTALLPLTKPFVLILQCFQELVGAQCLLKIVFHMHPTLSSDPAPGSQPLLMSGVNLVSGQQVKLLQQISLHPLSQPWASPRGCQAWGDSAQMIGLTGEWTFTCWLSLRPTSNPFIELSFYIWSLYNTPNIITETCSVSMVTGAAGELWDRWIEEQKGAGSREPRVHCAELICLCNV